MSGAENFISLGDAAAIAIDAGLSEAEFVAAVNSGVVDSRVVDGLPHVSGPGLEAWCRGHEPVTPTEKQGEVSLFDAVPAEWLSRRASPTTDDLAAPTATWPGLW